MVFITISIYAYYFMKFLKLKKKRKEYAYMVKMYNRPPYYDDFNNVPMSKKEIEKNKEKVVNNSRLKSRACGNKQPALEMDY